jgi:hypothetical protein
MSEKMISRRDAFSLLGLAAALGFALPAEVLTASDAEAQAQTTAPSADNGPSAVRRDGWHAAASRSTHCSP